MTWVRVHRPLDEFTDWKISTLCLSVSRPVPPSPPKQFDGDGFISEAKELRNWFRTKQMITELPDVTCKEEKAIWLFVF